MVVKSPLLTLEVRLETDVILARQRARQIAGLIGFPLLDQTRVATAVSEIARDAVEYAGGGRVEFSLENRQPLVLWICVRERMSGVKDLQSIVDGSYLPETALASGIVSARKLMDGFEIETTSTGASILSMSKTLSRRAGPLLNLELARIEDDLLKNSPKSLIDELQVQNQELLRALQELRERQSEVAQMHRNELEETNRGVVALYTELDEDVKTWRRMSDLKTRFLSNMSHEFRSPLNSILNLTGFLLDHSDGDLNPEQDKQVRFIRRAAEGLSLLVNDLLDIAKVEAGKATVRTESFKVQRLFENLGETIRPLIDKTEVTLRFNEPVGLPPLRTDEGKLLQVLRNFLSNAVKYTERGEIRVTATRGPKDMVIFSVSDTGIGIAPSDQEQVFEEFVQIEGPLQGKIKGTGLGLPLCRKLAKLLGGSVYVQSQLGVGSTFFFIVPRVYNERDRIETAGAISLGLDPLRAPVLVVEDNPIDLLLYEKHLEGSGFQIVPARTLSEARDLLIQFRPVAVLLDIILEAESGWTFLSELKERPETNNIPVVVVTSVDVQKRALEMGAQDFCLKPTDRSWLLCRLENLAEIGPLESILIIDDEEKDRYLLKKLLSEMGNFTIVESTTGADGLRRAREETFNVIFLDLMLPEMTGFEILDHLKSNASTQGIPVIITTSSLLEDADRDRLKAAMVIVPKTAADRDELLGMIREALLKAGLSTVGAMGGAVT